MKISLTNNSIFLFLILIFAGLTLAFPLPTIGMTINAASCSRADVQAAISSAIVGDTVNVPAGNCTWSSPITLSKAIYVVGAGLGSTNITGPGFSINLSADNRLEISDITFRAASQSSGTGIEILNGTVNPDLLNFHDVSFTNYEFGIWNEGGHGVVWNATFTNNDHDFRNKGYLSGELANHSPAPPWLYDSLHQFVVEDSVFNYTRSAANIRVDTEYPATFVIRYSTFNISGSAGGYPQLVDMHGSAGTANNQQGIRLYNNTIAASADGQFADIRGGVNHLVYNNVITNANDLSVDFSANPGGSQVATNNFIWNNTPAGQWSVGLENGATYTAAPPGSFVELVYPHPFRSGTPPPPDTTPPSVPTNLSATAVSSSQINLSWTASTDNVGVTGYQVERCQGSTCTTFTQVGTPSSNSYSDTDLTAATIYKYRVRATDAAGNLSSYSSIVNGTTQTLSGFYDLPADRQIPWSAGSDQWNNGVLPIYVAVPCSGLIEGNGTTNNGSAIQTCINNLGNNQAALIPPGIYYVNSAITIPSNKALRGSGSVNCSQGKWLSSTFPGDTSSGSTCTTLKLGSSGQIRLGPSSPSRGSEIAITSGYAKGSTQLTLANTSGLVVGDWVSIFEDGDPAIPTTPTGDAGTCSWCGENNGSNLIQQFAQITAINGSVITISRPLYYTYTAGQNPGVKRITWSIQRAGIEDIKLNGFADHSAFIEINGALFSWVKSVETYNAGSCSKCNHVNITWSHGAEIRDSYFHFGRNSSSDRNYGIAFFFWNSDHKVENNILRHHRHSISFEGGGSGSAILYNYIDDNYTDDLSYLGSARTNHGAHPMFNLYEGNHVSHLEADDVWGSSSHTVLFRNWLRGSGTGTEVPGFPTTPNWGFYALHVDRLNVYYSAVGNVLGEDTTAWNSATLRTAQSSQCGATRIVYKYGCDGTFNSTPGNTSINHGNYDFLTNGVAYWEGGSNQTLKNSIYYSSKPLFFGNCSWPVFGADLNPITKTHPAQARFTGSTACGGVPPDTTPPSAPAGLTVQ